MKRKYESESDQEEEKEQEPVRKKRKIELRYAQLVKWGQGQDSGAGGLVTGISTVYFPITNKIVNCLEKINKVYLSPKVTMVREKGESTVCSGTFDNSMYVLFLGSEFELNGTEVNAIIKQSNAFKCFCCYDVYVTMDVTKKSLNEILHFLQHDEDSKPLEDYLVQGIDDLYNFLVE